MALTGANGFLGWHTRCALKAIDRESRGITVGAAFDLADATASITASERLVHVAGVNRASDEDVTAGNLLFASQAAEALLASPEPPPVVVYANSIQVRNGSAYGEAKARAGDILFAAAQKVGSRFVSVELPNLFGEHGKPFYNSVVATFCHMVASGGEPTVENDKLLTLMHSQNAVDLLIGSASIDSVERIQRSVSEVLDRVKEFDQIYRNGDIPDVRDSFERDLFNTFRSYSFATRPQFELNRREDARGSFFEVVRAHGGEGQTSFSTTVEGISRGDHFHRRKIERFAVLSGGAVISMRRLFSDETVDMVVSGDAPVAVDMPTMWAHRITNTGDRELYTAFWSNEIFDPAAPDTFAEVV